MEELPPCEVCGEIPQLVVADYEPVTDKYEEPMESTLLMCPNKCKMTVRYVYEKANDDKRQLAKADCAKDWIEDSPKS